MIISSERPIIFIESLSQGTLICDIGNDKINICIYCYCLCVIGSTVWQFD